jgi:glycosyltransferase involved in cell wall biosynthesis
MPLAALSGKRKVAKSTKTDPVASVKSAKPAPKQHPWKVLHACELAREVLPLVEGQLAAGMRPFLLTPGGFGAAGAFLNKKNGDSVLPISLLHTWNHVREWRKLLGESAAEISAEVLHAHSFAAGMAAVRGSSGVVYQLRQTVEKLATAAGHCGENSWLARSFRVAEQFVLARAGAVVVNNHAERLACLERGLSAETLFLIPDPIRSEFLESTPDRDWLEAITNGGTETVFFVVPGFPASSVWDRREALLRWMRVLSVVRHEHANLRFVFVGDEQERKAIDEIALACNLVPLVKVVAPEMRDRTMATADVVICDREHSENDLALQALARGRALLASDVEQHRDITADGRGCLWFRSGEVKDISYRASFLASNPDFRRALAVAGREHCLATRSAEVIGAQYDAVYRVAFSKRKGRDNFTPKPQLLPLQVGS